MKRIFLIITACLLFTGCAVTVSPESAPRPEVSVGSEPASSGAPNRPSASKAPALPPFIGVPASPAALPLESGFVASLADHAAAPILARNLPAVEELRAAYRYIIERTYFADPVGLDSWRYHSETPGQSIPYVENRAISPLAYGIGSCEDFAAALTVLLTRMGYRAQYVSGLTISVQGTFVDHAWVAVNFDGSWYHLDPQLEQNIVRDQKLLYRYFLKSDAFMLADHRWGKNLTGYWGGSLNAAQQEKLLQTMTPPECPEDYPAVFPPERVSLPVPPDLGAILSEIAAESERYVEANEPLDPLELEIVPPIYALMPDPPRPPYLPVPPDA